MNTTSSLMRPFRSILLLMLVCASLLAACGGTNSTSNTPSVTLTLAAPNQWNNSGTSFGPGWEQAIATFQKLNPGVTVKVTVLPLASFYQTESTQLAAGTAPDILFNQATYKPYEVTQLDQYLNQPNPYAPERPHWVDWFDSSLVSSRMKGTNADGHIYWVPFNLFAAGLFVNKDAFTKAGVAFPLKTWEDWRTAMPKLKAAGYTPLAMDNSALGTSWTYETIVNMLLAKYFDQWNVYDASGNAGKSDALTLKDLVRAIKQGQLNAHLPEFSESLTLMKEAYNSATPNWSGIKGLSGAGTNIPDFLAGRAAMAWGANFGANEIQSAKPSFTVASMPWPTITDASTPLSVNFPAQFGAFEGSAYLIPSTTKGDQLKYAVRFMQFMTAPKYNQPWITATIGSSSIQTVASPTTVSGFTEGSWGQQPRQNGGGLEVISPQAYQDYLQFIQGYLLGSTSLSAVEDKFQASWEQGATYQIKQNPSWQSESWAK